MKSAGLKLLMIVLGIVLIQTTFGNVMAHMNGTVPVVYTTPGATITYWTSGHKNRRNTDTVCGGKFTLTIGNRIARDSSSTQYFQTTSAYAYDLENLPPQVGPGWIYDGSGSNAQSFAWWGVPPTSAPWGDVVGTVTTSSVATISGTAVVDFLVTGGNGGAATCTESEKVGYVP